ncbi:MAG: hypothetical protein HRU40_09940 [Saprospiraceae bacterium]|nr:hypothetical protein [Saprospiraceae bacterium]
MLEEKKIRTSPEANEHLRKYLEFLHAYRDKYFGNARSVRQVINEAIKNQNLRLAAMTAQERAKTSDDELSIEDVASFKLDKSAFIFNKKTIGFRRNDD